MLAASLNAFFCASPIYGSAEDFTFLLDITVSREVTPAAKQQIGETRKKCNSDDRRQWRKQGGAVGAAASRMQATAKQTLGAATRLSAATSFFPFRQPLWGLKGASSPFPATATTAACGGNREELLGPRSAGHECRPRHEVDAGYRNPSGPARRNRWWFSGSLLTSKENISLNANALCPAHRRENQLKEKTSPALWPARSASLYRFATAISARFSSRIRSSTVFTAVSTSAFGMRAMSTAHA